MTENSFLKYQLFCYALANIQLYWYDSLFRLLLGLSGNTNASLGPITVKIANNPLRTLQFYNYNEPVKASFGRCVILTIRENQIFRVPC